MFIFGGIPAVCADCFDNTPTKVCSDCGACLCENCFSTHVCCEEDEE